MPASPSLRTLLAAALLATGNVAGAVSPQSFFRQYAAQPDALAQRQYLMAQMPQLSPDEQSLARQLLATADCGLGLYDQALRDFPFNQREPLQAKLPQPDAMFTVRLHDDQAFIDSHRAARAVPAAPAIAVAARGRRLVMINEAHHDAHTRELVLQLLPLLRAEGYDHFAAEALIEGDKALKQRGYPVADSGSEYLDEPLYGEIVRTAIRLGYTLVPYDPTGATEDRETAEADNLYRRVFARDPAARLFVLAGYAHIDKAKGQLGALTPMAMHLAALTHIEPLSIDQTNLRQLEPAQSGSAYRWAVASYGVHQPSVLRMRGGELWSGDPTRYDISVILPPPYGRPRPDWLSLDGARHRFRIDSSLCAGQLPCVVEARYANESDQAIPADRYTFLAAPEKSWLYLRPGNYRLRAWGPGNRTLGQQPITVN